MNEHAEIAEADANINGTSLVEAAGISRVVQGDVGLEISEGQSRIKTFVGLNNGIPLNEYGLPEFIYRADLVPADLDSFDHNEQDHILHSAAIDISYREGYPTLDDGKAFWNRMEFEPPVLYDAFDIYLNMPNKYGVRGLETLAGDPAVNLSSQRLSEAFTYFYWAPRCKAFDLFRVAAYQKIREARIASSSDRHFLEAERLITNLQQYFKVVDDEGNLEWLADLSPGVAVSCLERLVKLQRISLGLPAHGSSTPQEGDLPANAHLEVLLKSVAQRADADLEHVRSRTTTDIDLLLENPEAAKLAQDLIIQMGRKTVEKSK